MVDMTLRLENVCDQLGPHITGGQAARSLNSTNARARARASAAAIHMILLGFLTRALSFADCSTVQSWADVLDDLDLVLDPESDGGAH
jgi:hypothetical protein